MNNLAPIQSMDAASIAKVYEIESLALAMPQVDIATQHVFHAGMYARTIMIPAGVMLTGALIKIATMLIVQGDAIVYIGDRSIELKGYHVVPASAGRKQAFVAMADTYLTMIFPTDATEIADAEDEFTDEADMLMSRRGE